MHELSESTKRIIDVLATGATAAAAGTAALTLADWALVVTIVAGLLNCVWTAMRIFGGARRGASSAD